MEGRASGYRGTGNLEPVFASSRRPGFCTYYELRMSECIDTKLCLRDAHARNDQQAIIIFKNCKSNSSTHIC